jgi:NAD+ kinase
MSAEVIVVTKRTAYSRHVDEQRDPNILRLIEAGDPSVARWKHAHDDHQSTVEKVTAILERTGARIRQLQWTGHGFETGEARLIVTVGGDGTLLAASHHVANLPILGVNSSPRNSVGFFCAARAENLEEMLRRAVAQTLPSVELARMQVAVGAEIHSKRVLNEALFCHRIPAATSRYIIEYGGKAEDQRSSGIWVGTAAGSTGAIRSAGGKLLPFSSKKLQLVAREPYNPRGEHSEMAKLIVPPDGIIYVRNKMRNAQLFLDGLFAEIDVELGDVISFRISDEPLCLLGLRGRRKVVKFERDAISS